MFTFFLIVVLRHNGWSGPGDVTDVLAKPVRTEEPFHMRGETFSRTLSTVLLTLRETFLD